MRLGFALLLGACGSTTVSTPSAPPPTNVQPAPPAIALVPRGSITTGAHHACAITAAGAVACWGQGGAGRLGTPGKADQMTQVAVPGLADVAGIAAGVDITCAWTAQGAAWCWGGDGEGEDHAPRRVPGLHDIVQIVTGFEGACGLRAGGTVACWSRDAWRDPLFPSTEDLAGFANVVELAGDDHHLCARTSANEVVCSVIPDDKHFRLREQKPTVMPELAGATSLAGVNEYFAALLPGRRLATWEMASIEHRRYPEPAHAIDIHADIAGTRVYVGGARAGRVIVCVLGGADRCWTLTDFEDAPGQRKLDAALRDLSIGEDVSCARRGDRAECWGLVGRLGDGGSELPADFVAVKGITDARQLEAGGDNACVLRANGRVVCWGGRQAMGEGGAPVIDREPIELPGVNDAIEIAMSYDAICARRKGGGATCWTAEFQGGELRTHSSPRLANAARLYSGVEVCGVQPNGDVQCTNAAVPAMHPPELEKQLHDSLATGVPCVKSEHGDAQCFHSAGAITIQHTQNYDVWCSVASGKIACHYGSDPKRVFEPIEKLDHVVSWDGEYALLANGTVTSRGTPAPIATLANVVELRENFRSLCARHRDGSVTCWGQRDYLGAGQRGAPGTPVTVAKLVMGEPRTVTPGPADVVRDVTPGGATTEIRGSAMQGPFADVAAACAAQPCAAGMRRDCSEWLFDNDAYAMPAPPAPFTAARLVSFECRDPQYRRDDSHRVRLLVTRADGAWLSAPMFEAGGNEKYCGAIIEPRWQTRDVVAGGSPEIVLSVVGGTTCGGINGGSREDVAMLVVAGVGAAKPFATAPIVTAIHEESSCPDDERTCTPEAVTIQLATTFGADGRLTIAGPASWPAIRRDASGAIAGFERDKTAAPPLGTFRFVAK